MYGIVIILCWEQLFHIDKPYMSIRFFEAILKLFKVEFFTDVFCIRVKVIKNGFDQITIE